MHIFPMILSMSKKYSSKFKQTVLFYSNGVSLSFIGLCDFATMLTPFKKTSKLYIFYLKSLKIVESKYFECDSNMVSFLKYPHVFGFIKRIFKNCKLCVSYPWHCLSYHFISRPVGGVWDKISAPSHYHFLSPDWSASDNNSSDWLVKNFLKL